LAEGVDVPIRSVYRSRLDYLVETDDEQSVLNASPDERLISRLDGRGLIISSASSREGVDFVSRCFYPKLGVYEDPVTGSAHCQLLPYWHRKTGHTVFVAEQLSERRGKLFLQLSGDRCLIGGQAVTVIRGSMLEHILK
jgi:predicted PhzF superfamily epimerase YddE/YHI9